jgi:hypothetical protein
MMRQDLSNDEAFKIYKSMLSIHRMGLDNSVKSMYLELKERGFDFSLWEDNVIELHKEEKAYKCLQVKYHLNLIKADNPESWTTVKLLKKWNTTYVMLRDDMFWDGLKEENVETFHSSSDIDAMLKTCGIKINKIDYFISQITD